MKWECFGFIVPAGLLWVFPEFSLVRYWRPDTLQMDEDMDIFAFARVRSTEQANVFVKKLRAC
jgi:hypothetical protein